MSLLVAKRKIKSLKLNSCKTCILHFTCAIAIKDFRDINIKDFRDINIQLVCFLVPLFVIVCFYKIFLEIWGNIVTEVFPLKKRGDNLIGLLPVMLFSSRWWNVMWNFVYRSGQGKTLLMSCISLLQTKINSDHFFSQNVYLPRTKKETLVELHLPFHHWTCIYRTKRSII